MSISKNKNEEQHQITRRNLLKYGAALGVTTAVSGAVAANAQPGQSKAQPAEQPDPTFERGAMVINGPVSMSSKGRPQSDRYLIPAKELEQFKVPPGSEGYKAMNNASRGSVGRSSTLATQNAGKEMAQSINSLVADLPHLFRNSPKLESDDPVISVDLAGPLRQWRRENSIYGGFDAT